MIKLDYIKIEDYCKQCNTLSSIVIDEFLMYYVAEKEDLESKMIVLFGQFKHVVLEIEKNYFSRLQAEYICHRIFKKDGYIVQYLKRPIIKQLPSNQYLYLVDQAKTPWRYSFSKIIEQPAKNFFQLQDIFSGEEYLLYSPGMQATLDDGHNGLWFLLINFNGMCWQSFGLIIVLPSFTPDDIFFYATEINPKIENNEDLIIELEANPIPFFMLISKSRIPIFTMKGHTSQICQSTDYMSGFNVDSLPVTYKIKSIKNVFSICYRNLESPPHFATAYYDANNKIILRTAFTEMGFEKLTKALRSVGCLLDVEPDLKLSPSMLTAAESIFNKKIKLNPYEQLFQYEEPKSDNDNLDKLNKFVQLALPLYNNNQEIDIPTLAREAGINEIIAKSVWNKVKSNFTKMKKKYSKR